MKRDFSSVVAGFPHNLMSTARSPMTMPASYARAITNMLMASDGAGVKRNGVAAVGDALGSAVVAVMSFQHTTGLQVMVATGAGEILLLGEDGWQGVFSGLNPAGTVRTVTFGGRLLLCNGMDAVMAWDGVAWEAVSTLVTDAAAGLAFVDASTFSIESDAVYYPVGSTVRATLESGAVTGTVASVSEAGGVVTVALAGAVLDATLSAVAFTVKPPRVAYLAAVHDRLWGFGKGPLRAAMSSDVDRLRVYYTHGVNDYAAWPDPATGTIPSLNLADKAGVADELLAMAMKDGMTVFLSRNHMQLWVGSDPGAEGDFGWSKTIPLGVVHGDAVLALPNDLLFLTRQGVRTLSRTVQTEQLDVSDIGGELDPTLAELLGYVLVDDSLYRRVVGMRHDGQGWFGLGLYDRTLVWQVGTFGKGWVVFDGDVFGQAGAAHTAPDGTLYVAAGAQLYRYDTSVWSDAGAAFKTLWWLPWINPAGKKRWANKYVEVLAEPGAEIPFTLRRYRDYDDANPRVAAMTLPPTPDYWDNCDWDVALWDTGAAVAPTLRDHVVADSYGFALETESDAGPFTLFGLKLYGVAET